MLHLKKPPPLVFFACFLLTSCNSSPPPVSVQQVQPQPVLPARLAVPCARPVAAASNSMDDLAIAQKQLYDQYGLCAGQLIDVIRCAQGGDCGDK